MLSQGGEWLNEAREWLQSNALNGDSLTWGSDEVIQFKNPITVKEFELFCAGVAFLAEIRGLDDAIGIVKKHYNL